jgi:Holliday junction DNA helicase RuvA
LFEFIKGTLEDVTMDSIVVENQGIAYMIYTSGQLLDRLPKTGSKVKIYLHMNVKEDDITLYGFLTKEERRIYRRLISVSGVGPKAALGILSVHTTNDIIWSIIGEDIKTLTKAPGIGKKIAQRIILELKDKLEVDQDEIDVDIEKSPQSIGNKVEVIDALVALGYQPSQAHKVIATIYKDGLSVETLIRKALKVLGTK